METNPWGESVTIDGISYPADQLGRKQDADLLTKVLIQRYKANQQKPNSHSYVINVNAEWGAGKTYFIKRWADDLKQSHPVVYIDAWSNDFMDSPIISVLSEIKEQLLENIDKRKIKTDAKKRLKNIGMSVLPKILAALVKRYGGIDVGELYEKDSTESSPSTNKNSNELDLSPVMEAMASQAFKEYAEYKDGVKALKRVLKELADHSIKYPKDKALWNQLSYPIFIFIDELDRCRPTYAVEMLEAIKHIFDIEGLAIVVSTHTEELQHTVKTLYGNNFNAENYLKRFFDSKYYLNVKVSKELLQVHCPVIDFNELNERQIILFPFIYEKHLAESDNNVKILDLLSHTARNHGMTARTALQFADRFFLCLARLDDSTTYDVVVLANLIALYSVDYSQGYQDILEVLKSKSTYFSTTSDKQSYLYKIMHSKAFPDSKAGNLMYEFNSVNTFEQCIHRNLGGSKSINEKAFYFVVENYNEVSVQVYIKCFYNRNRGDGNGQISASLFGYDGRQAPTVDSTLPFSMALFGSHLTPLSKYVELIEITKSLE